MCEAFSAHGHTVALMYMKRPLNESDAVIWSFYGTSQVFSLVGVPIVKESLGFVRYVWRLFLAIRTSNANVAYGRFVLGCLFAAHRGIPTVYESHFPVWEKGWWSAIAFRILITLPAFSHIVVISEALKSAYQEHYPSLKVIVAHDGGVLPTKREAAVLQGTNHALHVGYTGSLYEGKGMEVITELAPRIPDVGIHIIGGTEHDIAYWKQKTTEPNVHFYGFVEPHETTAYIQAIDVCLLPIQKTVRPHGSPTINIGSYTSPLKLFEYMAHGKAIIVSDVPVIREVLDETCARIVAPDDPNAWASAVESLRNEPERMRLGAAARERFMRHYTWEKRAEIVLKSFARIEM